MKEPSVFLCSEITRENAFTLVEWLEDDDVRKYLSDSSDVSKQIEQVVHRVNLPVLTHLFNQNGPFFMVYDRKKTTPVGFIRLAKKEKSFEIVIVIGSRKNWGRKLGRSAILESMKIAFFDYRAQKMIAKIHKKNKRSIRAFIHAGFHLVKENDLTKTFTITMEQYLALSKRAAVMQKEIYMTEIDRERLIKVVNKALNSDNKPEQAAKDLQDEINKAVVVNPHQIPQDIVTMNSRALINLDNENIEVSLVYPEDAKGSINKLSVLSPIGTAILGYAEGDILEWEVPSGIAEIHIKEVLYQPEAAGDYHM